VQFFLALFEEKIRKSLDQLHISRLSGWDILYPAGYPAGQFGIRPAGYPVHP
jgi:hypothetical protein